jgi:hypothetical protein
MLVSFRDWENRGTTYHFFVFTSPPRMVYFPYSSAGSYSCHREAGKICLLRSYQRLSITFPGCDSGKGRTKAALAWTQTNNPGLSIWWYRHTIFLDPGIDRPKSHILVNVKVKQWSAFPPRFCCNQIVKCNVVRQYLLEAGPKHCELVG